RHGEGDGEQRIRSAEGRGAAESRSKQRGLHAVRGRGSRVRSAAGPAARSAAAAAEAKREQGGKEGSEEILGEEVSREARRAAESAQGRDDVRARQEGGVTECCAQISEANNEGNKGKDREAPGQAQPSVTGPTGPASRENHGFMIIDDY